MAVISRSFLPVIGMVAAGYCALAILLALIDPLDLYPWGVTPILIRDGNYALQATPYLVDVVSKNPAFDTLFLGGSTGHFYTPQMIEETMPGTRRAFNLSYGAPSASDRAAVFAQVLRFSRAKRFILEADWTYIIPKAKQQMSASFPIYMYDEAWWNDVRGINMQTVGLAMKALRGRPLLRETWSVAKEQAGYRDRYDRLHTPDASADFAGFVARNRASIDTQSELTCGSMDAISGDLAPFVKALSARGAEIDIILPVYSWMMYYWTRETDMRGLSRPSLLSDLLLMRECLVRALDGLPGVNIFAFDDVPGLASDLGNYFDPGHLYNAGANRYILQSIADGRHRLSLANIRGKNSEMRAAVIGYQFTNATIWNSGK
jgi:hypothetical protein